MGAKYLLTPASLYDAEVKGVYDTETEAIFAGAKEYVLGTFAVQETGVDKIPTLL